MMAKITAHLRELLEDSSGAPDPMDLAAICDAMDAAYDIACRRYEAALVALEREQGERAELVAESVRQLERVLDAVDVLCKENEKLRGLCVKALEWLRWAGGITCPPEVPDEFADELRELGVEVE